MTYALDLQDHFIQINLASKMKNKKVGAREKICNSAKFTEKGHFSGVTNFLTRTNFFIFHFRGKVYRDEMILKV